MHTGIMRKQIQVLSLYPPATRAKHRTAQLADLKYAADHRKGKAAIIRARNRSVLLPQFAGRRPKTSSSMVQINREAVRRSGGIRSRLLGLVQFLVLSAVVPLLFILRYSIKNHLSISSTIDPLLSAKSGAAISHWQAARQTPAALFAFLKDLDFSVEQNIRGSDVVELYHCDLSTLKWSNFTGWAFPLLNQSVTAVVKTPEFGAVQTDAQKLQLLTDLQEEFILQLLEQYASDEELCDYSLYRPTVYGHENEGAHLLKLREHPPSSHDDQDESAVAAAVHGNDNGPRLAIIIIAFHDIGQLTALVDALYLPDHYIIIHLERRCPTRYKVQVDELASNYENVVVLQFGTITYRTDSVSMINLRIIRWLTLGLELSYDYLLTLDGSAFPLVSPKELTQALKESDQEVWMGELTHKGEVVDEDPADHLLRHKRLYLTRGNWPKLTNRLPLSSSRTIVSETIRKSMTHKSTSGNQAIYSHHVIHQLLASDKVMELFALSKYGCCCCLEERNWIAALSLIGLQDEGLLQTSMFQLWGGKEDCQSSMNNALLSRNASVCYRIEDPGRKDPTSMYIMGDELWEHIEDAKERGFLFARKFSSDSEESVRLMTAIQTKLWEA